MRVISPLLVVGMAFASSAVVTAQSRISPPFSKLFRPPSVSPGKPSTATNMQAGPGALNKARAQRPQPKVVCGMTIVPVDSSLDPKIKHPVPANGTKFTLKIQQPPMCGQ